MPPFYEAMAHHRSTGTLLPQAPRRSQRAAGDEVRVLGGTGIPWGEGSHGVRVAMGAWGHGWWWWLLILVGWLVGWLVDSCKFMMGYVDQWFFDQGLIMNSWLIKSKWSMSDGFQADHLVNEWLIDGKLMIDPWWVNPSTNHSFTGRSYVNKWLAHGG